MAKDPGFQRYKNAILSCISRSSGPDLLVQCLDGEVRVPGLVLAAVSPAFRGLEERSLGDCCLILPDLTTEKVGLFLEVLCHGDPEKVSAEDIRTIGEITKLLSCSIDLSQIISHRVSLADHAPESPECDSPESMNIPTEATNQEPESSSTVPAARGTKSKRCTVSLAGVEVDSVTDEVLSDNYSDQEGRLVCLVCYKLHGPLDHKLLRTHIKQHTKHQLERVSITLPVIGKGGPGLRKKFLTDFELEDIYRDPGGGHLQCNKCDKQVVISDKTAFRKHLAYHNLKEKNYVYRCDKCPSVFKDPSNLKRHVENIHEKQMFRCLHCDFEDNRKRRLEDHLLNAHNDKVQCEEEPSLDKGEGSAAIADLNAANGLDSTLATFNSSESSSNVFLDDKKSPNIVQKYSYQCTGCKFRKRKLAAVEDHIREHHSHLLMDNDSPQLLIKKIALKSKDISDQTFFCSICEASFKKRTLLNQHNFKVHHIQLDTDFACHQCGIVCANLPGLKAHVRAHQAKRFLCGTCGKSFLVLSQLKDHVDKGVCLPENRKCNICSKTFSGKHHLEMHMRLHTNEKPFSCNICEKAFAQKRSLKEHLLTHNAERHFKCEICDKKFVQKNHLKYHLASQHSDVASDIAKHSCPTCGKMFPFPFQLKRHQKSHVKTPPAAKEEPGQGEVQCIKCTDWFPNKEVLSEHYKDCSLELLNNLLRIPREFTSENITQISVILDDVSTNLSI